MRAIVSGSALGVVLAALGVALAIPGADAHAAFVTSMPAPDSTVAAPAAVTIIFSQAVSRAETRITVSGPAGVVSGATSVSDRTASAPVQGAGAGVYTVQWSNVSLDDGHEAAGSFQFTVAGVPAAQPAAPPARPAPAPPAAPPAPAGTAQRTPFPALAQPAQAAALPPVGTGIAADRSSSASWLVLPALLAVMLVAAGSLKAAQRKE
jgi:hypothetical protein